MTSPKKKYSVSFTFTGTSQPFGSASTSAYHRFHDTERNLWWYAPNDAVIEELEVSLMPGDTVKLKNYAGKDYKTVLSGPHKMVVMGDSEDGYLTVTQDGHHSLIRAALLERVEDE